MIIDDIALTLQPRIGPRTAAHLLECFGNTGELYSATADEITARAELNRDLAAQIAGKTCHKQAEKELAFCRRNGVTPIASDSEKYPVLLRESNDFPHVIYYKGDISALGDRRMISMVGTRRMTSYGQKICDRIIGELAGMLPDLVIVSGLAYGVDGACHRAALAHGLSTVAVLPNRVTDIYPAQHTRLAEEMIARGGGILSEYNSTTKMKGVTFLARNRIIAAMSAGTLVVESPVRGGSMITARLASGYDRSVMAVPGRVGDTYSEGTNKLISTETARMVCSAEDIARELMWDTAKTPATAQPDISMLSKEAQSLFGHIRDGETVSTDQLAVSSGLPMPELATLLFELELEGAVHMLPGKLYERA